MKTATILIIAFMISQITDAQNWHAGYWSCNYMGHHPGTIVLRFEVRNAESYEVLNGCIITLEGNYPTKRVVDPNALGFNGGVVDAGSKKFQLQAKTNLNGIAVLSLRWKKPDYYYVGIDEIEKVQRIIVSKSNYKGKIIDFKPGLAQNYRENQDPGSFWTEWTSWPEWSNKVRYMDNSRYVQLAVPEDIEIIDPEEDRNDEFVFEKIANEEYDIEWPNTRNWIFNQAVGPFIVIEFDILLEPGNRIIVNDSNENNNNQYNEGEKDDNINEYIIPTLQFNDRKLYIYPHDVNKQPINYYESKSYCESLSNYGFEDWFLPTIDDLNEIFQHKETIGGFKKGRYWSASPYFSIKSKVWTKDFSDGTSAGLFAGTYYSVNIGNISTRCIRSDKDNHEESNEKNIIEVKEHHDKDYDNPDISTESGKNGWFEDFEDYDTGKIPDKWNPDANANDINNSYIDNQENQSGYKSLKLYGDIGGCNGALAYYPIESNKSFEISIKIMNGSEQLSGCHPDRGGLGLREGTSWSKASRELLLFKGTGTVVSSTGQTLIKKYQSNQWYNIRIRYLIKENVLEIFYWINDNYIIKDNLDIRPQDKLLNHIELVAQEGSAWFDNIKFKYIEDDLKIINQESLGTEVGVSYNMEGRYPIGNLNKPSFMENAIGRVVVLIIVNRNGEVISAIPGHKGTTIMKKEIFDVAQKASLATMFNKTNYPNSSNQEGTITYDFNSKSNEIIDLIDEKIRDKMDLNPDKASIHSSEMGEFIDSRDGKTYKWIKIGTQVWMAENLNYLTSIGSACYDNKEDNCKIYGRLYTHEKAKNACPNGWYLPSDGDWKVLEQYLGMSKKYADEVSWRDSGSVGCYLKSTYYWPKNSVGTNSSGFNALPGGYSYRGNNKIYYASLGHMAYFWSSFSWYRELNIGGGIKRDIIDNKRYYSVRCIRK